MKKIIMSILALTMCSVSSLFADNLINQSIAYMHDNIWYQSLPSQFGTTFSVADEDGTDAGFKNIPLAQIYRLNMSVSVPSEYGETVNGQFVCPGSNQYAIVSDPQLLNSSLANMTDGINRLVMHNVASGSDIISFTMKNCDVSYDQQVMFNIFIDEVSGTGSGEAVYGLYLGDEKLRDITVASGIVENAIERVLIDKSKLSSKFTLTLRRTDSNAEADNFVLAFYEVMMTGVAKVVSGVSIEIKDDEGVYLGSKVTITASVAEGIEDDEVSWETKSAADGNWTELNYKGLELIDTPQAAGVTLYRAKYQNEDGDWIYSNEVSVTRIMACDGKLSNQLFFENFGTLASEKAHAECANVPYKFMDTCKPLKNGGEYAVVANAKWAGCTKYQVEKGEDDACREDADHYWYRDDLRSVGGDTNGGMLMLNCKGGDDDVLYQRSVEVDCPNTTVTFSFFVAQASKSASDPIAFQIQLVAGGNVIAMEEYNSGTLTKDDGWKAGSMQFNTGTNTVFDIVVVNNADYGGNGNDILLDNMAFSICTPSVTLDKTDASPGVKAGKRVVANCDDNVELQADADAAGIVNPYYLWVVKENNSAFTPNKDISGANKNTNTFTPTADKKYSTYVILATTEDIAEKYFNGESVGCSPIAVTDTMSVTCSIPTLAYSRECNEVTLEAMINPGDKVTWFKSENGGTSWEQMGVQTASAKDYSLKKVVTITSDTKFKIETESTEGVKNTAVIDDVIKYKKIELYVSATDETTAPSTIAIDIDKNATAYFYPKFTGFEASTDDVQIKQGDDVKATMQMTDVNASVAGIAKAGLYYAAFEGCQSNDVTVNILGTVEIELVERDCNTVTFKAITTAPTVQWGYVGTSGEFIPDGDPKPASSQYTHEVTYSINNFKASIGSGASTVYSEASYQSLYNLVMEGSYDGAGYSEDQTINADYNGEVTLSMSANSFAGSTGKAQFYSKDGTLLYSVNLEDALYTIEGVKYKFNATKSDEYYLKVNGCQSGTIKVVINNEVSIEKKNTCNLYTFTATVKGDGVIKWYFDNYSQNPVEIPGTEGKLEIEYESTEDGIVTAKYGDASDEDEVSYTTITLTADKTLIEQGDDVTFTVTPNSRGWLTGVYTSLYKDTETKVGNQVQSESPDWTLQPQKTATYYAKTETGCRSNDVTVRVKGYVEIEKSNVCNTYTLKVKTEETGTIVWKQSDATLATFEWIDIPGTEGKSEIKIDVTDVTVVKAVVDVSESSPVYLNHYNLTLTATPSTIEQCGGEAILEADMTMVGQIMPVYTFYKKGVETPIQDESWDNTCPTGELYSKSTFVVKSGGCTAETDVNVNLVWPTIFMPYKEGSTNQTFDVCAKSIKIFDRTGNMIADVNGNSWDGICTNGTAKGSYAMPDVYFYVATLEDGSTYKGTVEVYKETKTSK